jgi:signal transduction histidine kinase
MTARFDERMAERNRLSGELHDTLLQSVQASKMLVNTTLESRSADAAHMRRTLERLAIWLTQAAMESRAALSSLRRSTTQRNDLAEALQQAADTSDVDRSMRFTFVAEGATREMHPIVRDEVFRIGAEAIRNAFLHSEGTELRVTLHYARDLTVRVRDNGRGIPEDFARNGKPGHFGLSGMQERAIRVGGRLRVVSNPDAGTDVELVVPGPVVFCAVQPAWRRFFNRTRHPFQLRKDDTKPN